MCDGLNCWLKSSVDENKNVSERDRKPHLLNVVSGRLQTRTSVKPDAILGFPFSFWVSTVVVCHKTLGRRLCLINKKKCKGESRGMLFFVQERIQ